MLLSIGHRRLAVALMGDKLVFNECPVLGTAKTLGQNTFPILPVKKKGYFKEWHFTDECSVSMYLSRVFSDEKCLTVSMSQCFHHIRSATMFSINGMTTIKRHVACNRRRRGSRRCKRRP